MKLNAMVLGLILLTSNSGGVLAEDDKVITKENEVAKFCPVCGPHAEAEELSLHYKHEGKKHYFCSMDCLKEFKQNPQKYLKVEEKTS